MSGRRRSTARGKTHRDSIPGDQLRQPQAPAVAASWNADIGVSAHRLVLTMTEQTGNIWMLDNVDR